MVLRQLRWRRRFLRRGVVQVMSLAVRNDATGVQVRAENPPAPPPPYCLPAGRGEPLMLTAFVGKFDSSTGHTTPVAGADAYIALIQGPYSVWVRHGIVDAAGNFTTNAPAPLLEPAHTFEAFVYDNPSVGTTGMKTHQVCTEQRIGLPIEPPPPV